MLEEDSFHPFASFHAVLNSGGGWGRAHSLKLGSSRRAAPEEAHDAERAAQHVPQHGREAAVGREVGKEVGGLPVRQPCMHAAS